MSELYEVPGGRDFLRRLRRIEEASERRYAPLMERAQVLAAQYAQLQSAAISAMPETLMAECFWLAVNPQLERLAEDTRALWEAA